MIKESESKSCIMNTNIKYLGRQKWRSGNSNNHKAMKSQQYFFKVAILVSDNFRIFVKDGSF